MVRVTYIAVNIDANMPDPKVIANPLIGPVPNKYRITAVKSVVMFASKIVEKAFS